MEITIPTITITTAISMRVKPKALAFPDRRDEEDSEIFMTTRRALSDPVNLCLYTVYISEVRYMAFSEIICGFPVFDPVSHNCCQCLTFKQSLPGLVNSILLPCALHGGHDISGPFFGKLC